MTSGTRPENAQPQVLLLLAYLVGCLTLALVLLLLPLFVPQLAAYVFPTRRPYYEAAVWASAGASTQAIYVLWLRTKERAPISSGETAKLIAAPWIGLVLGPSLGLLANYLLPLIFVRNPPALVDVSSFAILFAAWSAGFLWETIIGWFKTALLKMLKRYM